jgi:hypothetical protein
MTRGTPFVSGGRGELAMTSRYTVRVPAPQAGLILDALVGAYAAKADALASAVRGYRAAREPLDAVTEARRDLIETEAAIEALGWHVGPRLDDVEFAGPTGTVREVLYDALLAATRTAHEACRAYERGRIDRTALAATVADTAAVLELFATLEESDAPDLG